MKFLRFLTKKFFVVAHIIIVTLFLISCLTPFVNPVSFWPISFFGLAFPVLLMLILFFLLFWLFLDYRYAFLSIVVMAVGWKSIAVFFAVNKADETFQRPPDSITLLSYNVRYFTNEPGARDTSLRNKMMELIKAQQPDIACFQEFFTSENPKNSDNKAIISDNMDLPYRYFSSDHNYLNNHSGSIIFSKYPIIHSQKIKLMDKAPSESVVYADIVKDNDTIRIFTMHLQSIYLNKRDLAGIEKVKDQQDTALAVSKTIFAKLKKAFIKRGRQAVTVSAAIRESPYPVVICGDFNDTPNSYTYFKIKGKMQDAFLKKGFGIGPTYTGISPTLRIDYILADHHFTINAFKKINVLLSDHYPIVANISLRN